MTHENSRCPVQVRWSDFDGLGHVNHSTMLTFLEVGRDDFLTSRGVAVEDYVVRRCEIDYLQEVAPPTRQLHFRCEEIVLGRTSIRTVEQLLDPLGRVVVEARMVLVMWDHNNRSARPLTADEREAFSVIEETIGL